MRILIFMLGMALSSHALSFDVRQVMTQQSAPVRDAPEIKELSPGPYPTKEALLGAASSGELREYLDHLDYDRRVRLNGSLLTILQSEYDLPAVQKYADIPEAAGQTFSWKNKCLQASGEQSDALAYFYWFRINDHSKLPPLPNFQAIQDRLSAACSSEPTGFGQQYLKSFASFMQDYSDAIDIYVAALENSRAQQELAAEARREAERAEANERARRQAEAARQASLQAAETARAEAEMRARAEAEAAQQASLQAAETARAEAEMRARAEVERKRQQRLNVCLVSNGYKAAEATWEIELGQEMLRRGQTAMEHDDQVARVSGTQDLRLRRQAGELVVAGRNVVNASFKKYKQHGGTATAASEVRRMADPCEEYR